MSIVVECGSCHKRRKAPERMAGKRVRCSCGGVIVVPEEVAEATPAELDLSEVALMSEGERVVQSRACPSCLGVMPEGAILCVSCGYNTQTGMRIGETVDSAGQSAEDDSPQLKRKKMEHKPMPVWIGTLAKYVVILALLGGFSWGAWHVVKAVTFDPTAQREADMLKISPRMKVEDVVAAIGKPPKDILTERDPSTSDNVVKFQPKKLFWSSDFMDKHTKDDLKYGFSFVYKYTEREQLVIWFNPDGEVEYVEKHDPLGLIFGK